MQIAQLAWRYRYLAGLVALVGLVAVISFHESLGLRRDFHHFYTDARYVWEHGQLNQDFDNPNRMLRRQLPFYLPVVPLMLAPVAFAGAPVAAAIWSAMQVLCVAYSLKVLWGWCRGGGARSPELVMAGACILGAAALYEATKFNQLSIPVLALLLGSFDALERRRLIRGGTLLALAAVIKLLPALLIVWLALKRQWTALTVCLVGVAAIVVLPCLAVFGPQRTLDYHREWAQHNLLGAPAGDMADEEQTNHFIARRNQGLPVVLSRLCGPTHPYRVSFQPVKLSEPSCLWLARAILAAMLAGLIWRTRRRWDRLGRLDRQVEFAVYLLAMMLFSPLLRQYYLVWALPAVLLFVQLALDGRDVRIVRHGGIGILVWVLGMLLWTIDSARACGAHWAMLLSMGVLLLSLPVYSARSQLAPQRR